MVCPLRSIRMLCATCWPCRPVSSGGRAMGRKGGMGVRVASDRLDAVILEERIAEARGVHAGYRCLALLHRAEAAVPRGTVTILAAIFAGAHCRWRKQSTQHDRRGQCRNLFSPCLRCVLLDPHARRARVKAGKSRQIGAKERAETARRIRQNEPAAGISHAMRYDFYLPRRKPGAGAPKACLAGIDEGPRMPESERWWRIR